MSHYWYATMLATQSDESVAPPEIKLYWVLAAIVVLLVALFKRKSCTPIALASTVVTSGLVLLYGMGTPLQTWVDGSLSSLWEQFGDWLTRPLLWGLLFGALSLILMMPLGTRTQYNQGMVAGIVSLGFLGASVPIFAEIAAQSVFWILALVTIVAAAATVSMRSPVYSAIWFALSLLGTAGLFFYQGSQFLGVATIVVYAGAIVVTFLFVVMLAQPEGHATYDRLSWGRLPKILSVAAAALLVACLAFAVSGAAVSRQAVANATDSLQSDELSSANIVGVTTTTDGLSVTVRVPKVKEVAWEQTGAELSKILEKPVQLQPLAEEDDVLHDSHMARLGAVMFTRHLLSVELAGTLLLVALVGAIAMAIQGKHSDVAPAESESSEVEPSESSASQQPMEPMEEAS